MRFVALFIGLGALAGGLSQPAWAQEEARTHTGVTDYVDGFNRSVAAGDIESWTELWADNAQRILPSSRQSGRADIRRAYRGLFEAYSEMRLVEKTRTVTSAQAIVECQFDGILRMNGNRVSQPVTLTIRFDQAGKIVYLRAEFDEEAFLNQARAQRA